MYTEYVFDNKKYDVVAKELKATIFDIVTQEEANLVTLRDKIASTEEGEVKDKLIDICDQQEQFFIRVINSTNELVNSLQILDSFSKEIKNMENENLAQIIASYEQKENTPVENVATNEDELNNNDNEASVQNDVPTEEKVEEEETVNSPEVSVENESEEEKEEENESSEEVVENSQDTESEDSEEKEVVEESTPVFEEEENESQNIMETESEPVFKETSDEDENTETTESVFDQEVVEEKADGQPVIDTASEESGDSSVVEESEPVIEETADEQPVIADTASEESGDTPVVEESEPVIDETNDEQPVVDTASEESGDSPAVEESESVVEETTDEQPVVADANETSTSNSTDIDIPVITEANNEIGDNPVFNKSDTTEAKVILTNSSQIAKLRASRDTQSSLLTAKGFFKLGGASENTGDVSEQQLIDNGLLPPEETSLEDKIEQMMQQVTQLYNEGKMEEAQKLSDEVSELIQQNQQKMVA